MLYMNTSPSQVGTSSLDYFHVTRMINEQFMAMLFLSYGSAHLTQMLNNNNMNISYRYR